MAQSLNECLEEVNNLLSVLPYAGNTTFYKLAYLQPIVDRAGNEVTFPIVRRIQSEGYQVSPQDIKSMIFYHRLIEETDEPIPDQGKGTDTVMFTTYTVRLVGIGHRRKLSVLNDEDNADLARAVKLLLNGKTLSDRSKIWPISTNSNKNSIFGEEWAGYNFNHLSLELTAFSIDYNIKQRVVCNG